MTEAVDNAGRAEEQRIWLENQREAAWASPLVRYCAAAAGWVTMTTPEERQPVATLECVVLDCPDPGQLATFYRSLLGGTINQPDRRWALGDRWATLHTPTGQVLAFQFVDAYVPPRWPDPAHPQQFHLDFHVDALERAHPSVISLGARLLESAHGWRVYADPAGHPFCLVGK